MNQNPQSFQNLNKEVLRKLLTFAQYGIAQELKQRQENIIAQQMFKEAAVDYIHSFNPLRTPKDGRKEHDDLVEFAKQVQQFLDHVQELRTDEAVKKFIQSITKS